jgi:hypothetical protein
MKVPFAKGISPRRYFVASLSLTTVSCYPSSSPASCA